MCLGTVEFICTAVSEAHLPFIVILCVLGLHLLITRFVIAPLAVDLSACSPLSLVATVTRLGGLSAVDVQESLAHCLHCCYLAMHCAASCLTGNVGNSCFLYVRMSY